MEHRPTRAVMSAYAFGQADLRGFEHPCRVRVRVVARRFARLASPSFSAAPAGPCSTAFCCASTLEGTLPGARASRPLEPTGGPSAHLRAGRPRSQEPLRSAPFLGARASCPLEHTGGPSAHMRAGRPRSQGRPLRSAPSPGPRASCPLEHTGGPTAHMRAGRPRSQGRPLRSAPSPGPRASCPLEHTGGPSAHLRAGRPRSRENRANVSSRMTSPARSAQIQLETLYGSAS